MKPLRAVMLSVGLGALLLILWTGRTELAHYYVAVDWMLFLLSVVVAVGGNFAASWTLGQLLSKYGIDVPIRRVHELFFYGQIVKYAPGKIWTLVYQGVAIGQRNAVGPVVLANVDVSLISVGTITTVGLALLIYPASPLASILALFAGAVGVSVVCMACVHARLVQRLLRRLRQTRLEVQCIPGAIGKHVPGIYFVVTGSTYVIGGGALLLGLGYGPSDTLSYLAYFALAWVAGVLVFIMPAGLGVREWAFVLLAGAAGHGMQWQEAAALALVFRAWQIVQELMGAGLVSLLGLRPRRTKADARPGS